MINEADFSSHFRISSIIVNVRNGHLYYREKITSCLFTEVEVCSHRFTENLTKCVEVQHHQCDKSRQEVV